MSRQYLYRLQPIREGFLLESTSEEDRIVSEHFRHLQQLTQEGVVLLAGRTLTTDPTSFGLVIFETESDEAARADGQRSGRSRLGLPRRAVSVRRRALAEASRAPSCREQGKSFP